MTLMNRNITKPSASRRIRSIKVLMIGASIVILVGTAFFVIEMQPGLPILEPLQPSQSLPSEDPFWEIVGNLSISARISCHISDTHRWDSFEVDLNLRVNNTGPISVLGFHPVKLSIFNDDHWHYFTFGLVPSTNTTIEPFSNVSLSYKGDRILNTIEGIAYSGHVIAYGRVLISYWDHEIIITTSIFDKAFPIE